MAVTSPVRAVLTAHLQATANRILRQLGRPGLIGLGLFIVFFSLVVVLPLVLAAVGGAYLLAQQAFRPGGTPELVNVFGVMFTVLPVFGGVIGGTTGGAQQLAWEQYRAYPLRAGALFVAELLAGFGDVTTGVVTAMLVGAGGALAVAAPEKALASLAVTVAAVGLLLGTQLVIGSLAERMARRLRLAVAVTLILPGVLGSLARPVLEEEAKHGFAGVRGAWAFSVGLSGWVPASMALGPWPTAWLGMALSVALGAAAMGLAFWLMWRDREAVAVHEVGQREAPWSFTSPLWGIARLQFVTLLGSHLGKFAFTLPVFAIVIVRGLLAELTGRAEWMVPAAFIYVSLAATGLGFNQFGLDGHGVKALFLLPVSDRTILQGKQLGFAGWQGLQAGLLVVLLLVIQRPTAESLVTGVLTFVCFFFAQGSVGQFTSCWLPRRLSRTSMKNGQVPLAVALISLATTAGSSLVFGGALGVSRWLEWNPVLVMTVMAGLSFAASRPLLALNARMLERYRERVLETVG